MEVEVKVETAPANRGSKPVDETRGAGCTYGHAVAIVHNAVAVNVFIFDVARLYGSPTLLGRIANVVVIAEEALCNKPPLLANAVAFFVLVGVNVVFVVAF